MGTTGCTAFAEYRSFSIMKLRRKKNSDPLYPASCIEEMEFSRQFTLNKRKMLKARQLGATAGGVRLRSQTLRPLGAPVWVTFFVWVKTLLSSVGNPKRAFRSCSTSVPMSTCPGNNCVTQPSPPELPIPP